MAKNARTIQRTIVVDVILATHIDNGWCMGRHLGTVGGLTTSK